MNPAELSRLAELRTEVEGHRLEGLAVATEQKTTRSRLQALRRRGVTGAEIRKLETTIAKGQTRLAELRAERSQAEQLLDRLRLKANSNAAFETAIRQLDGQVPITMLPVRLETRFSPDRTELKVRIYPDTVHQDGHEPELTDEEHDVATTYWTARWADAGDEADEAAWQAISRRFRPTRARWIVDALTPRNLDQLGTDGIAPIFPAVARRPAPWTRAPKALLLPERWVLLGYRGDEEVLRRWTSPVADDLPMGPAPDLDDVDDPTAVPPATQDELSIDDVLRWVTDFDRAEKVGMAATITRAEVKGGSLAAGFDVLMAVGVDWTRDPKETGLLVEAQLRAHAYSDGLSFPAIGTPTNVTADGDAVGGGDTASELDPRTSNPASTGRAGSELERALGLPTAGGLAFAPGAAIRVHEGPRDMQTVLWEPTWGYFLEQIMRPAVSGSTINRSRDHFRDWVRPRGPLAPIRVGKQPYGVLPVMAPARWKAEQEWDRQLMAAINSLRSTWGFGAESAPRMGATDKPDEDLVALLRQSPRSEEFRFRPVTGPSQASALNGLENLALTQETLGALFAQMFIGGGARPEAVDMILDEHTTSIPFPLVGVELSETDGLDPNFIGVILGQLSRSGGFRDLIAEPEKATSILEALLRYAAQQELARGAYLLVLEALGVNGQLVATAAQPRELQVHGAPPISANLVRSDGDNGADANADAAERAAIGAAQALGPDQTTLDLVNERIAGVTGRSTAANFMAKLTNTELRRRIPTRRFADFRSSLDRLQDLPTAELDRLAAETLDCASHRLDAWITSMATKRLDEVRDDGAAGCHIGGYGWVDDLRPDRAPDSLGYLHAPSVGQATTAAILRSGHLSRRHNDDGLLAIDLSSDRVAVALGIVEGMREGQPIGALLGYRFERGLRERNLSLAGYILEFRLVAPLATATEGLGDTEPLEAVAARDVVDGVKLVRQHQQNPAGLLQKVGVRRADRAGVVDELDRLADALDAVADLLVSESVHQAVLGNSDRSAAALDALDRQVGIPEVSVTRTPRTGHGINHRLVVALSETSVPTEWAGTGDPRSRAEPRLNGWIAGLLGDPGLIRFAAVFTIEETDSGAAPETEPERTTETRTTTLADLDLSPLSAVLAAVTGGGSEQPAELFQRIADELAPAGTVEVELLDDPPAGSPTSAVGLREFVELAATIHDLVSGSRSAVATDLFPAAERVDRHVDVADLTSRADRLATALDQAGQRLPTVDDGPTFGQLRSALLRVADVGVLGAVPTQMTLDALHQQAEQVRARLDDTLARLAALDVTFAEIDDPSDHRREQHQLARIRLALGDDFPVVPRLRLAAAQRDELDASHRAGSRLVDDQPLAATEWLQQHALVRPAVDRLRRVLDAAEMRNLDVGADQLDVMQLPHRPDDRWVGLPTVADVPLHVGATSVVAHNPSALDVTGPFAAIMVDQWSESIPRTVETTGLSFHYDAPGARAPQSVLVAVPPDRDASGWQLNDVIDSVREARQLSRLRLVDLDLMEAAGRFVPATYLGFNLEQKTPSFPIFAMVANWVLADNIAFQEGNR